MGYWSNLLYLRAGVHRAIPDRSERQRRSLEALEVHIRDPEVSDAQVREEFWGYTSFYQAGFRDLLERIANHRPKLADSMRARSIEK